MQLMSFFTLNGLSKEEARQRIWLVDSQGLVYNSRGRLADHKKCRSSVVPCPCIDPLSLLSDFSRTDYQGPPITDLEEIITYVKPTALLGLSTISVSCLTSLRRSIDRARPHRAHSL